MADSTNPLAHHEHTWTCKEPGCGVQIPILDGFGESIMKYHRLVHTAQQLADVTAQMGTENHALRAELKRKDLELQAERAARDAAHREVERLTAQVTTMLTAVRHASNGMTVHLC